VRFPLGAKIEKIASRDESRPVLTSLYLRIVEKKSGRGRNRKVERQGFLEATDSYKAIRVPVDLSDDDVEGFVPVEAITRARQRKLEEIKANTGVRVGDVVFDRPTPGTWPVLAEIFDTEELVFSVGLNAAFLKDLAEGLGADHVRIEFQGVVVTTPGGKRRGIEPNALKPYRVTPLGGGSPDAEAILMPVLLPESPR